METKVYYKIESNVKRERWALYARANSLNEAETLMKEAKNYLPVPVRIIKIKEESEEIRRY